MLPQPATPPIQCFLSSNSRYFHATFRPHIPPDQLFTWPPSPNLDLLPRTQLTCRTLNRLVELVDTVKRTVEISGGSVEFYCSGYRRKGYDQITFYHHVSRSSRKLNWEATKARIEKQGRQTSLGAVEDFIVFEDGGEFI